MPSGRVMLSTFEHHLTALLSYQLFGKRLIIQVYVCFNIHIILVVFFQSTLQLSPAGFSSTEYL